MDDRKELEKIAEKYKQRNKYINEWQKDKYYRLTVLIPKDQKDQLAQTAKNRGFKTVSDYVKNLIDNDIQQKPAAAGSDFFPDYKPTKTKLYEIPAGDDLETITQAQAETPKETDAAPAENGLDKLLAEISKNHGLL